jgi:hypothetical protein
VKPFSDCAESTQQHKRKAFHDRAVELGGSEGQGKLLANATFTSGHLSPAADKLISNLQSLVVQGKRTGILPALSILLHDFSAMDARSLNLPLTDRTLYTLRNSDGSLGSFFRAYQKRKLLRVVISPLDVEGARSWLEDRCITQPGKSGGTHIDKETKEIVPVSPPSSLHDI